MELKKIKTNIEGLDQLLYGGLHLHPSSDSKKKTGTVIAIRGEDSVHKLQFSMQLMCGIAKSLYKEESHENQYLAPEFYSLSMKKETLEDICFDFQICNALYHFVHPYQDNQDDSNQNIIKPASFFTKSKNDTEEKFEEKFRNDALYYNPRTSHVHYRRPVENGDAEDNSKCKRKTMTKLFKGGKDSRYNNGIVNVNINNYSYTENESPKAFTNFLSTMDEIGKLKSDKLKSCIVIHGFSQLTSDELKRLPLNYLVSELRKKSMVSILVFDTRGKDLNFDADMFIDMRRNEDRYLFHELKICESTHQVAALGWHQYKLRDHGIEVFPSLHMIVHRRYYLSSSIDYVASKGMPDIPYSEFLRRKYLYSDSKIDNTTESYNEWNNYKQETFLANADIEESDLFKNIILGKKNESNENDNKPLPHRRKITALIGNPNTFKRLFSNARAYYNSCVKSEHTLVILFDKEPSDYRQKFICPYNPECKSIGYCANRLHLLSFRMGGITPDELLYKVRQVLDWNYEKGEQKEVQTKIKHIIIDDLQKVDYSFPFLKEEPLFLPALIAMCKDRNVGVNILCDKNSSTTEALCALADEVITFEREEKDVNSVRLNVGRSPEFKADSEIHRYCIKDVHKIFTCDTNNKVISVNFKNNINVKSLGSLRSFWREGHNVHILDNEGAEVF